MLSTIDPTTFVDHVRPLLERNDPRGLIALLKQKWNARQVADVLRRPDLDARKVSLLCLALFGTADTIPQIAAQLLDPDTKVNELAEHALWSIWFRSGSPEANTELCRASQQMSARNFDSTIDHLNRAIDISPGFAEPFNQRALVRFMMDEYEYSIGDCRRAIRLMPCHFAAWAGMGHCFLHLGQLDHALRAYDRAIAINPHLHAVAQSAAEIRRKIGTTLRM